MGSCADIVVTWRAPHLKMWRGSAVCGQRGKGIIYQARGPDGGSLALGLPDTRHSRQARASAQKPIQNETRPEDPTPPPGFSNHDPYRVPPVARNFLLHGYIRVLEVKFISRREAVAAAVRHHYLHRAPPYSVGMGLFGSGRLLGFVTFGCPASRHLQIGACPSDPGAVIELNRLWVSDEMPRNTETWFLRRALALLPPKIVVSYADTAHGHFGFVCRAANFEYAGWTDMERKTPRLDYLSPGKHTRDAFRSGNGADSQKVRRSPKVKYWIVTGNKREKRKLRRLVRWPSLCWKSYPPPAAHLQLKMPGPT